MPSDVYFGDVTKEINWRDPEFEDLSPDDDEELVPTPQDVVDILGFDPRDEDVAKAGDGIMIAWFPPAELAGKLAQDGGENPEELHVTLAYLGKQEVAKDNPCRVPSGPKGGEYCSTGGGGVKLKRPQKEIPRADAYTYLTKPVTDGMNMWVDHPVNGLIFSSTKMNMTHVQWFDKMGLPTAGKQFDRWNRGSVEFDKDTKTIKVNSYSDRIPSDIWRVSRSALPANVRDLYTEEMNVEIMEKRGEVAKSLTDDQVQLLKDTVEEYCSKYAPLQGTLGGNGRFPATPSSDDKDVLIKMVDVALLEKFREGLIEELSDRGIPIVRNHGYTPHMTLAYVDPDYTGECTHPETLDIVIDALTVAIGAERHVYPLNGDEVLKMEPTTSQVHSDKLLADEEKKRKRVKKSDLEAEFGDDMEEKIFNAEIIKVNTEKKQVFGWASLISKNGVPIEDTQGDLISADDLEKMAYGFVSECRVGGEMHVRKGVGKLIESLVLTVEKAKAMGIELPGGVEGWWTGWQVTDDDVWDKVRKGVYKAFSVHGVGIRTKIDKE